MKTIYSVIVMALATSCSLAKPGGTYTLTGNEKGISEIVEADMKNYPELYKGESLNGYISKLKKENRIGKVKLSPGDQLTFPATMASMKAEKERKKTNEAIPRHKRIYQFEHKLLPGWTHNSDGKFYADLESGSLTQLLDKAEESVDEDFAQAIQLRSFPEQNMYILEFQMPEQAPECFFAVIQKTDDGFNYFTLEMSLNIFGGDDISMFCGWGKDGSHSNMGERTYNNVEGFLKEHGNENE